MDIKMIITDLDSTLLRSDKTISDYTADILRRCRDKGLKLVFATARPKRTVVRFLGNIETDALIVHNGAVIQAGDKVLDRNGIAIETKTRILQAISRDYPSATISVEIDDLNFSNFDMKLEWAYDEGVITDFTDLPDKPADKIAVGVSSHDEIAKFAAYLPDDLYIQMCDGRLGLIMHKNATKMAGIENVCRHFGISISQTVAFGDDYNDITMLKSCGVGVAVDNAIDEAKAAADFICAANDDDGVAKWLESSLL